jgi:hypothetical protein
MGTAQAAIRWRAGSKRVVTPVHGTPIRYVREPLVDMLISSDYSGPPADGSGSPGTEALPIPMEQRPPGQ